MAVQLCGREMGDAAEIAEGHGVQAVAAGWSLCHGAGGPVGVVALAADVCGVPEHREQAVAATSSFVRAAPVDPEEWPCGLQAADGDVSLVTGVAGTAMVLADLALSRSVPSLVLLGLCGVRSEGGGSALGSLRPGVLAPGRS